MIDRRHRRLCDSRGEGTRSILRVVCGLGAYGRPATVSMPMILELAVFCAGDGVRIRSGGSSVSA